jgi:hypothetical protein
MRDQLPIEMLIKIIYLHHESPHQRILKIFTYSFPSFDTTSLDDVSDSVLIHLLEFIRASVIELSKSLLKFLKFLFSQVLALQLNRQLIWLLKGYQQHRHLSSGDRHQGSLSSEQSADSR